VVCSLAALPESACGRSLMADGWLCPALVWSPVEGKAQRVDVVREVGIHSVGRRRRASDAEEGGFAMSVLETRILDNFKALLAKGVSVHKVILFGSRARGDADPQSDLDVVVILEDGAGAEARAAVSACAWAAGFEHGIVVMPVVFTRAEWEEGPERESLLVKAVVAEGVVL